MVAKFSQIILFTPDCISGIVEMSCKCVKYVTPPSPMIILFVCFWPMRWREMENNAFTLHPRPAPCHVTVQIIGHIACLLVSACVTSGFHYINTMNFLITWGITDIEKILLNNHFQKLEIEQILLKIIWFTYFINCSCIFNDCPTYLLCTLVSDY